MRKKMNCHFPHFPPQNPRGENPVAFPRRLGRPSVLNESRHSSGGAPTITGGRCFEVHLFPFLGSVLLGMSFFFGSPQL